MIPLLALAVAVLTWLFFRRSRRQYMALPRLPETSGAGPDSSLSIVIPARNEERNIARVVGSFTGREVIVVDDASSDRTAELAQAAGARVVAAPRLEGGLTGKPNACQAGAMAGESDWILFVDADTRYQPAFVPSLLDYAVERRLDVATVFLYQERLTWPERILLPYAFALYFCGVNARRVNSAESREALANGQCLLFRRSAYEQIGGHTAVKNSVIEDVELAALAKSEGLRLEVLRAEHLGTVRMYEDFPAIWRGFRKNSFRFLLVNPWTGLQVMAASTLITSYLPILLLLVASGYYLPALLFALIPPFLLWPWYERFGDALTAPLAIYGFQTIALAAMLGQFTGWKTTWKGRPV